MSFWCWSVLMVILSFFQICKNKHFSMIDGSLCHFTLCSCSVKNWEKYLQVLHTSYVWALPSYHMFTSPLFQIKLHYEVLSYSVDFKAHRELWNPLRKAIPGKFHRSGRHSKYNCLQDQTNAYRSWAWQIVLIVNTALGLEKDDLYYK